MLNTIEEIDKIGVRTSNDKGKHSELLAQVALISAGYTVLEPINPQPYDLVAKRQDEKTPFYIQVKTVYMRDEPRYGGKNLVIKGAKNSGKVYTKDEVDMFIAVWEGECYMIPNREVTEYWVKKDAIDDRWTKLNDKI